MFARGENIGCGTSTTGTGTLTLAADPSGQGLSDPVTAFGTSGAWPCSYTIIEFTSNTYAAVKQIETGNGTLTLAASLTSATLARNPITVQVVGSSYVNMSPTAMSIGTAANTVIILAPTANDLPQGLQGYTTTLGDGAGFLPEGIVGMPNISTGVLSGSALYWPIRIPSGVIKSMTINIATAVSSPTSSSIAMALYEVIPQGLTNAGLSGKMVINFGTLSANPMATTGNKTATASAASYVPGGWYYPAVLPIWAGGSGSPTFAQAIANAHGPLGSKMGFSGNAIYSYFINSQTTLTDPATITSPSPSYALQAAPALAGVYAIALRGT